MNLKVNFFIKKAIKLAKIAETKYNEVPIGAVIVNENKIIAKSINRCERTNCSFAHAELIALKKASEILNTKHLNNCHIYVNLEPCPMCYHAIFLSKIKKIYFSSFSKLKTFDSIKNYYPNIEIYGGIMEDLSNEIIDKFFKKLRN